MQGKKNIDELLQQSADNLVNEYQDDWDAFDAKLSRALFFNRIRRVAWIGAASAVLIFLFLGQDSYLGSSEKEFYIPRNKEIIVSTPINTESEEIKGELINVVPVKNNIPTSITADVATTETQVVDKELTQIVANSEVPATATTNSFPPQNLGRPISADAPILEEPTVIDPESIVALLSSENSDEDSGQEKITNQRIDNSVGSEELIFLNHSKGLGIFERSSANKKIRTESNSNTKYAAFDLLNTGSMQGLAEVLVLKLPVPIRTIAVDNSPFISPLQEENAWSYSLNVYPNFTFRKFELDPDKANLLHTDFEDAVQAAESGGFSLNLGFQVNRRIGPVTYLNTGIEYISYKTEVLYDFTNFRQANINKGNGFIDSYTIRDRPEQISFADKNIYHYVNFPLSIAFRPWASNHVRLNIEAGGSFLYFLQASGQTLDYKTLDVIDLSERDFRNSIGSLSFKVGAHYYVSQRINIGFEPTLMYFTNTIYNDDYPFYVIPYSVGLNFSLQVKLN